MLLTQVEGCLSALSWKWDQIRGDSTACRDKAKAQPYLNRRAEPNFTNGLLRSKNSFLGGRVALRRRGVSLLRDPW